MNEKCWFIYGRRIGKLWIGILKYHSQGGPAHVNFDWEKAQNPSIIGFFHSHPIGMLTPSSRDDRTMGAWVRSEGRGLICGIYSGKKEAAYLYYKSLKNGIIYCPIDYERYGCLFIGKWE